MVVTYRPAAAATELRAREAELFADDPEERHLGLDVERPGLAIQSELDHRALPWRSPTV
jgi:hypothetical protein